MSFHVRIQVGSELYAMPVANVIEVAKIGDVVAVPGSRAELLGVRDLRGQILPVVDLALLLGIQQAKPPGHLLVAEAGSRRAGFAIHEVSEVGELPEPGVETQSDLLRGAALVDNDLIGVVDVARVFDAFER